MGPDSISGQVSVLVGHRRTSVRLQCLWILSHALFPVSGVLASVALAFCCSQIPSFVTDSAVMISCSSSGWDLECGLRQWFGQLGSKY